MQYGRLCCPACDICYIEQTIHLRQRSTLSLVVLFVILKQTYVSDSDQKGPCLVVAAAVVTTDPHYVTHSRNIYVEEAKTKYIYIYKFIFNAMNKSI